MGMFQMIFLTVAVSVQVASEEVNDAIPTPKLMLEPPLKEFYPSEKVTLKCEIEGTSDDWNYKWYKNGQGLQNSRSLLEIKSAKKADTGFYSCQGIIKDRVASERSDAVELQINETPKPKLTADPNWTEFFPDETITLTCGFDGNSDSWSFEWLKNGKSFKRNPTLTITTKPSDSGPYTCKGKLNGRSVVTQHSDTFQLNVRDQCPKPILTKSPDSHVNYNKESLTFKCDFKVDASELEYLFFQDSLQIHAGTSNSFSIQTAQVSHSGKYGCQVKRRTLTSDQSDVRTVTVKEIPKAQLNSEWKDAFPGETVSLQCVIPGLSEKWIYMWFRNDKTVTSGPDTNVYGNTLLLSAESGHTGLYMYVCQAQLEGRPLKSAKSTQHPLNIYGSRPTIIVGQDPQYPEIYTGEQVKLKCSIQEQTSNWAYQWEKDKSVQVIQGDTYTIQSATLSHNGLYTCHISRNKVTFSSEPKEITIIELPQPKLSIESEWKIFYPTEKITLKCSINANPNDWRYEWYKDEIRLSEEKDTLLIKSADRSHSGGYKCKAKHRQRSAVTTIETAALLIIILGTIPKPEIRKQPSLELFYTNEQILLSCSRSGVGWAYHWFKDSKPTRPSITNTNYIIKSASPSDAGEYYCKAKRGDFSIDSETLKVQVKEPSQPKISIESQWKIFYPSEKITLRCSINENPNDWRYEWCRNKTKLSEEKDTLLIKSADRSHSGSYKCKAKHRQRSEVTTSDTEALQILILDPTPKPDIKIHPTFEHFYTDERIHLDCYMSGDGWEYDWYKDLKPTQPSITNTNYTIDSASLHHKGDYTCEAKRGDFSIYSEPLKVDVQARSPAVLTLVTELSDFMAGNILTLRCEVSDGQEWNYTWYENGQELNESLNTLKVESTEDTIKNEFKCRGERTARPLYSSWSEGFVANNIVFKRKLLLGISGCFVTCILILIIGCIVLKITRKPEKKEKVREDLFISMADSKNQATSPLMECINNKATEKESGEKEDLHLNHISVTHVDGVIKEEDSPPAEANGLTSFKGP